MNRRDLTRNLGRITSELLREKGYISFVDVFTKLEYLNNEDIENWRRRRVPYLEKQHQCRIETEPDRIQILGERKEGVSSVFEDA